MNERLLFKGPSLVLSSRLSTVCKVKSLWFLFDFDVEMNCQRLFFML